ncbi:VOC family protein [Corynebacterium glyciniphilum]|uniref:VOC family protein n=1 Tax=Corynebacterium glyciniphilum TaxID=1404244 RepID=UPI00265311D4|nr:VOC family protein [Corynebacterium glyciniphilum]MDN5683137.1 VOC family protein [Corynebacterium glyciniphilum]MDN6707226.1 VOC family protein [Corynebacterium glyciniphilum]
MKFLEIALPVHDPSRWVSWLSGNLGTLPADGLGVTIGWTTLRFTALSPDASDTSPDRGHHLAFAIPTGSIDDAARRVEQATGHPLLDDDGATVIVRGGNWASRSIYFTGPENSVLELIEHADRPETETPTAQDGSPTLPTLLGVAEIGRGVADVAAAGDDLAAQYGDLLPHGFGDPGRRVIAAYGDIDGAVVLAKDDRPWYPTQGVLPRTEEARFRG